MAQVINSVNASQKLIKLFYTSQVLLRIKMYYTAVKEFLHNNIESSESYISLDSITNDSAQIFSILLLDN